jgi:hypothetical protein
MLVTPNIQISLQIFTKLIKFSSASSVIFTWNETADASCSGSRILVFGRSASISYVSGVIILWLALKLTWSCYINYILSRVRGSVTKSNGFWIGWLNLLTLLLQSTITARYRCLLKTRYILLDCDFLLIYCDWFGSDLRVTHFWFTNELRMPHDDSSTIECVLTFPPFIHSGITEYKSSTPTAPP